MTIRVNGQDTTCAEGMTLLEYLADKELDVKAVVVELNRNIVRAEEFGMIRLAAGDELEILQFVGGG